MTPAGASAGALDCRPAESALTASPMPIESGMPQAFRQDPDGWLTMTTFIDDPRDANPIVSFATTDTVPQGLPEGTKAGTWYHQWEQAPEIITVGVWIANDRGNKVRIPLAAIEGLGGSIDAATGTVVGRALIEAFHHLFTTAPYAWNFAGLGSGAAAAVVPMAGGLVAGFGPIIATYFLTMYPAPLGWESYPPVYVWETYKNASGHQAWGGQAIRRTGNYSFGFDAAGYGGVACNLTRVDQVVRADNAITAPAGVWVLEQAEGRCDGQCMSPPTEATFDARQRFTSGTQTAGIDTPLVVVEQTGHKRGSQPFLMFPDYQRETIAVGVSVAGSFVPLIGGRAETWHAAPPQRQRRLISFGAFDPLGAYHPVIGVRMLFERHTSDLWLFILALDGVGSREAGDAMIDLGTFDHTERFVPLLGTKYDDDFPGHRHTYRAMVSTGPYVAEDWNPLFAVTYDGKQTLSQWAFANLGNQPASMQEWFIATGAWNPNPLIGYRPIVGVRYRPEPGNSSEPIRETYRVGVFPADYQTFIPLAGADYHGRQTSVSWAAAYAGQPDLGARRLTMPSASRITVGVETPATGYTPVLGARLTPGSPQRVDAGVWTPLGYVPLVTVCQGSSTGSSDGQLGVGVGGTGGPIDTGLVRVNWNGPTAPTPTTSTC